MPLSTSSSFLGPFSGVLVLYTFPYGHMCPCPNSKRCQRCGPVRTLFFLSLTLSHSVSPPTAVTQTLTLAAGVLEPASTTTRAHDRLHCQSRLLLTPLPPTTELSSWIPRLLHGLEALLHGRAVGKPNEGTFHGLKHDGQ